FQIWWRILMPLSKPALGTVAVFSVLTSWNALSWPADLYEQAGHAHHGARSAVLRRAVRHALESADGRFGRHNHPHGHPVLPGPALLHARNRPDGHHGSVVDCLRVRAAAGKRRSCFAEASDTWRVGPLAMDRPLLDDHPRHVANVVGDVPLAELAIPLTDRIDDGLMPFPHLIDIAVQAP